MLSLGGSMVVVLVFDERGVNVVREIKNVGGHHNALDCELCTCFVTTVVKRAQSSSATL